MNIELIPPTGTSGAPYFAAVDPSTDTPSLAVVGLAALAVAYVVGLVIADRATVVVWGYMATAGALIYAVAYVLAMLALSAYGLRTLGNVLMLVAAAIAVPAFVYVLYNAVSPPPASPLDVWTWVGVGVSAAACVVAVALRLAGAQAARTFGRSVQVDTALAAADEARGTHCPHGPEVREL